MDCLKKKLSVFPLALLASMFILPLVSTEVFATTYTSAYIAPSTGTIWSENTAISIYVNSGSADFAGVDLDLAFTGDVTYVSGSGKDICDNFNITEGTNTLNVTCLSLDETPYNGAIATLYFKATASGTSVFTLTNADTSITITTLSGGTYTLSTDEHPCGSGSSASCTDPSETVPDTGLFDDSKNTIIFGVFLLILGIFWNRINDFAYATLGKIKEDRIKSAEEKAEKKRKRWEDKF